MAESKKEESTVEKVERELNHFKEKKTSTESLLKEELKKAQTEYEGLIKDINIKYNVKDIDEEIKRHSYFLRLLKGEIAIPDDLNAKKAKVKPAKVKSKAIEVPEKYEDAKAWNTKILFALSQIESGTNEEVIAKLVELDKAFDVDKTGTTITQTLSSLKGSGRISTNGKKGKKDIYILA
ncbi:hypothetical protein BDD43_2835 [Mucilaginibacter gracilis]|uniref:Uncharacterized protein n=1 Tax=Mucilaginibacter gracilis TaxID=423350 RepID=A0A495J110_9SPHI|nr:hypothetical protein [Mucilaginibacter gracilis]RKR82650.1 hypothetical protein BDD43_2835 [Mucilaginibacter gracilis]